MTDWLDKQLGKYRITEFLGRGAMAEVYRAYQPTLERDVAIKIIHPHLSADPQFIERFQHEARIVAGLRHPGIVQVYDFDVEEGACYMVIEYVAGESLKERLLNLHQRGRRLPLTDALLLFRLVVGAVAYAHQQGVIHRDLKPANVLLTRDGQPVLTDFGLSKIVGSRLLTELGTIVGTPAYISPEQAAGEAGDERSDIYSLGVMLYELVTGIPPFSGDSPLDIILKHLDDPLPPPRSIRPDLPESITQVIEKALAKTPAVRFQTAEALLMALIEVQTPQLKTAERVVARRDRRCPYRGLQVFEEEHADFYFGREALVGQLVEKFTPVERGVEVDLTRPAQFLTVLGASGSGKSSLVRAGLVPALRRGEVPGSADWMIEVMRPGNRPLAELAARLALILLDKSDRPETLQTLHHELLTEGRSLHRIVRRAWPDDSLEQRLLLVVDQFEEVFTLCDDEEERRRFTENLLYATAVNDGRVLVVLTMRADFYHHCAAYRDLAGRICKQQLLVGPMNEAELRRAIEQPARQVDLQFEPGLIGTILGDVGQEPGALPLLQHALLELWERRQGGRLTLKAYRASGGVSGAIAQRADSVYESFGEKERAIVRRIMLRLTHPGEGTEDTRRRVRRRQLLSGLGQPGQVEQILQQLADARLITTSRDMASDEEMVDVSHEALIRGWGRLRRWLDEDRTALRLHHQLTEATEVWEENNRDPSYLYHGGRLVQAEDWAGTHPQDLNALEVAFLKASREAVEAVEREKETVRQRELAQAQALAQLEHQRAEEQIRTSRWLRWLAGGLGVVFLAAVVAAFLAMGQQQEAQRQAATAESRQNIAEVSQAKAVAAQQTAEAEAIVRATAQAKIEAEVQARATAQAVAEMEHLQANKAQATAEAERSRAEQQARLALARQLMVQAGNQLDKRLDLAVLLSLQANQILDTIGTRSSLLASLTYNPALTTFLQGHTNVVYTVAYNPDGTQLATGAEDQTAIIWDVVTGQRFATLKGHTGPVSSVAYRPDGTQLATASWDKTVIVWDVASGQRFLTLRGHTAPVNSVAYSPDGLWLASGSEDQTAIIWNAASGQQITTLKGHTDIIYDLAYSPTGDQLATGSFDKTVILWNMDDASSFGQPLMTLAGHTDIILTLAYSPDGTQLATGALDNTVMIWDTGSGEPLATLEESQPIDGLAYSPDGRQLATGTWNKTVTLWDVDSSQPIATLVEHDGGVTSIAYSPDGAQLATASADHSVILWSLLDIPLEKHSDQVIGIAYRPDGGQLATGSADQTVILWDLSNGHLQATTVLQGHTGPVNSVAYRPDGLQLVTASDDGSAIVWDSVTGKILATLRGHSGWVYDVAYSPVGNQVATAGIDNKVIVWDVSDGPSFGQALKILEENTIAATTVAFSPDGTRLAAAGKGQKVIIWDVASGQSLATLEGHTNTINRLVYSPDGRQLATGSSDQTIILWDVASGQLLTTLRGHTDAVTSVAYNAAGTHLVSGSLDQTIMLWDVSQSSNAGDQRMVQVVGCDEVIWNVAFSPVDQVVASRGKGNTIRQTNLNFKQWPIWACRMANRNLTEEEWHHLVGPETPYQLTCPELPAD
ncbi:MAG: protein kinase [Anaerolineae bacterium]|nr:protein kinase [Anaerolineae bacterium]